MPAPTGARREHARLPQGHILLDICLTIQWGRLGTFLLKFAQTRPYVSARITRTKRVRDAGDSDGGWVKQRNSADQSVGAGVFIPTAG